MPLLFAESHASQLLWSSTDLTGCWLSAKCCTDKINLTHPCFHLLCSSQTSFFAVLQPVRKLLSQGLCTCSFPPRLLYGSLPQLLRSFPFTHFHSEDSITEIANPKPPYLTHSPFRCPPTLSPQH